MVDDGDFDSLSKFKWSFSDGYAARVERGRRGGKQIKMHRQITNASIGVLVDHRDTNGLNNQRYNLRLATQAQNLRNRGKNINNTTGFKGVTFCKTTGRFRAQIKVDYKMIHLGRFSKVEDAAKAYAAAAAKLHGEFHRIKGENKRSNLAEVMAAKPDWITL